MNYTKEQILEKYKNLPEDVKDAIFSVDTAQILQKIGKENKLTIEKIGILADETGAFMMGITPSGEFISNLAKRLEIGKNIAEKITHEINKQVFSQIRESLKQIHGEKTEIIESKDIFEERNRADIFRSETETEEKKYADNNRYQKGADPYREPLD